MTKRKRSRSAGSAAREAVYAQLWQMPAYVAIHEAKDALFRRVQQAEHGARTVHASAQQSYRDEAAKLNREYSAQLGRMQAAEKAAFESAGVAQ